MNPQIQLPLDFESSNDFREVMPRDTCTQGSNSGGAKVLQFPLSRKRSVEQEHEAMLLERILRRSARFGALL
ncbi:hypothetical protein [Cupriavidus pampae]|nr:hypothetical protein [Cupriavidus pampae]